MAYFRLFRVVNLLIIAFIMYFLRYFLFEPVMEVEHMTSPLSDLQFAWLVLTYLVLTAGGYALNDYYDIGMDEINRPGKTVLRNILPLKAGLNLFFILTAIGVLSGFALAWTLKSTTLYFIPVFVSALYWFYTTKYKREFISGNLVVSFLAALGVGIVFVYYVLSFPTVGFFPYRMWPYLYTIVIVFASFAFYLTFIREIVKDVIDTNGDKEFGCDNIPIRFGMAETRIILIILASVLLGGIGVFAWFTYSLNKSYLFYYLVIVMIPMSIYLINQLVRAKEIKDYKAISLFLKIMMVVGMVSLQILDMSNKWS